MESLVVKLVKRNLLNVILFVFFELFLVLFQIAKNEVKVSQKKKNQPRLYLTGYEDFIALSNSG